MNIKKCLSPLKHSGMFLGEIFGQLWVENVWVINCEDKICLSRKNAEVEDKKWQEWREHVKLISLYGLVLYMCTHSRERFCKFFNKSCEHINLQPKQLHTFFFFESLPSFIERCLKLLISSKPRTSLMKHLVRRYMKFHNLFAWGAWAWQKLMRKLFSHPDKRRKSWEKKSNTETQIAANKSKLIFLASSFKCFLCAFEKSLRSAIAKFMKVLPLFPVNSLCNEKRSVQRAFGWARLASIT